MQGVSWRFRRSARDCGLFPEGILTSWAGNRCCAGVPHAMASRGSLQADVLFPRQFKRLKRV